MSTTLREQAEQNRVFDTRIADSQINCSAYIALFIHQILLFWSGSNAAYDVVVWSCLV